jgi:competence protein ComEC
MLVVPLMEILMPAAISAMVLGYASAALAKIPVLIAGAALEGIAGTVRWLGGLRVADLRVPTPGIVVIILSALSIVVAMALVRRRPLFTVAGLAALGVSAFWISMVRPHPQIRPAVLEMTAIDVGQGDSILLVSPNGRTLLVDAGGLPNWVHSDLDIGEDVVSPYLWSRSFTRLDAVAITHTHADHMGGAAAILANFRPRELWLGDLSALEMAPLLRKAAELGCAWFIIRQATALTLEQISAFLHRRLKCRGRRNDESLVMKFVYGETSLCWKAMGTKIRTAIRQETANGCSKLLIMACDFHHSTTAGCGTPRFALISWRAILTAIPRRGSRPAGGSPRPNLPDRSQWRGHVLSGRQDGQPRPSLNPVLLNLVFLNSADIDFGGLIAARGPAVLFNHAAGFGSVLFAHQNNSAANSGKNVLLCIQRRDIGINSGRVKQAVHDQRFRFLLGVKHSHQFFVRIGARGTVVHSFSDQTADRCSQARFVPRALPRTL